MKLTGDGIFIRQWGKLGSGPGEFDDATDMAVDDAGYVYVVDDDNGRVQKFSPEGQYETEWGNVPGDGELTWPRHIAVYRSEYVYVTDLGDFAVKKYETDGVFDLEWHISAPAGIDVSDEGDVYVGNASTDAVVIYEPDGTPRRRTSTHSSGRCSHHGGNHLTGAPKGNENARIHGLYSRRLQRCGERCVLWGPARSPRTTCSRSRSATGPIACMSRPSTTASSTITSARTRASTCTSCIPSPCSRSW